MLNRRSFLALAAALAAQVPAGALARPEPEQSATESADKPDRETLKDPWRTLAAVQAHMLPGEIALAGTRPPPSAAEIGALEYLRGVLAAPDMDKEDAKFLRDGVGWLNEIAMETRGLPYAELGPEAAEEVMRRIERTPAGERWLYRLLDYLLEALLADPVYGGNRDGRGWAWLGHRPGFPRPTPDKLWFKLGKPVYRRTKA